ncbi:RNA polymerase sigma-70 factor [Echinicola sp. CAU 1574]|uniref:RNA polymerase sigma-70 factor n=1 Tax=Echinicola arenosa TaxID=2774144 RepID=A0ABR9AHX0_9BACT|nr:RNA polymerase sigma-70 factor [Echinicola arenosa]MBD8488109.1 RNA polymerase sigma-70 factor [Echinicola arenosa]
MANHINKAAQNQEMANLSDLETIFYAYHRKLVYFAFQYLKDQDLSEDVVQEVFIKLSQNDLLLRQDRLAIQHYLYKAVKNKCFNLIRDQKVHDRVKEQLTESEWDDQTIIHKIIQSEVIAELYAAISSLPEKCQEISRMGYLHGKTNQEIAQELGVSVNTVKTQKQRGLKLLRHKLNPEALGCLLMMVEQL